MADSFLLLGVKKEKLGISLVHFKMVMKVIIMMRVIMKTMNSSSCHRVLPMVAAFLGYVG